MCCTYFMFYGRKNWLISVSMYIMVLITFLGNLIMSPHESGDFIQCVVLYGLISFIFYRFKGQVRVFKWFLLCAQKQTYNKKLLGTLYLVQREKLRALFYRALDKLGCRNKLLIGMATIFHTQLHLDFDLNLFVYEFTILVCRVNRLLWTCCFCILV